MALENQHAVFVTIGASNHSDVERDVYDYYATDPYAVECLLDNVKFDKHIWECACGEGHISNVLERYGYDVISTDLIDRGFGVGGVDFFDCNNVFNGDIVTNPPYKHALKFVSHAIDVVPTGHKVAMLLRILFLEGKSRRTLFEANPPREVLVFSSRISCALNGDFEKYSSGAQAYAWFIWEKGYKGDSVIKWIN